MELDLASEHVEGACYEPDSPVGMTARAAATNLTEPAFEPREVGTLRAGEPFETAGNRIEPVHARTTLPGALAREERARRAGTPTPIKIETATSPGGLLRDIACPSTHQCTVLDSSGEELTFDPTLPGMPTPVSLDSSAGVLALVCR